MVFLWMWSILKIASRREETNRCDRALYVFTWKVAWTPDNIVPFRIVELLTRIPLALGVGDPTSAAQPRRMIGEVIVFKHTEYGPWSCKPRMLMKTWLIPHFQISHDDH